MPCIILFTIQEILWKLFQGEIPKIVYASQLRPAITLSEYLSIATYQMLQNSKIGLRSGKILDIPIQLRFRYGYIIHLTSSMVWVKSR